MAAPSRPHGLEVVEILESACRSIKGGHVAGREQRRVPRGRLARAGHRLLDEEVLARLEDLLAEPGRVPSADPTAADRVACDSSAGIPAAWAEEPVMTAAVRPGAAQGESSANRLAQAATSGHLAMARHLRHRVEELTADERLGAGQLGRIPSRS